MSKSQALRAANTRPHGIECVLAAQRSTDRRTFRHILRLRAVAKHLREFPVQTRHFEAKSKNIQKRKIQVKMCDRCSPAVGVGKEAATLKLFEKPLWFATKKSKRKRFFGH
jgi:hypothetical protein